MMKQGIIKGVAAGITLVMAVTACAPTATAPGGLAGLAVNAEGEPVMVATWCGAAPDGVVVYRLAGGEFLDHADIKPPPLTGTSVSMSLEKLPPGWQIQKGDLNFIEGQTYAISPYSTKTHVRLREVNFTTQSKNQIPRGKIMIQEYSAELGGTKDVLLSQEEFNQRAERYC
ncbi:hypothetical protein [Nonomuraea lactucae]|uniref:hypothetical protein n=1 Tax=Nonomuraea lactucae TaxID=2249762 RepID=UPI0013B3D4B1|nr:hypothetical protein [Nonomuraea lactucae]